MAIVSATAPAQNVKREFYQYLLANEADLFVWSLTEDAWPDHDDPYSSACPAPRAV